MVELQDHYQILRLARNATQDDIKRAFRLLARQYHPDLNPNNAEAAEKFRRISKAYEVLSKTIQSQVPSNEEKINEVDGAILQDSRRYYIQAVNQATQKNYPVAIAEFTRAIQSNPQYIEAYLGRAQVLFSIGDDRGVLEDCRQILNLKPDVMHAQYLQGRAYHRLGDVRSAIEGYSNAIVLVRDYAKAYYNRGLAHIEIQEQRLGVQDLQSAARLFRKQNNISAYRRTRSTLTEINRKDTFDPGTPRLAFSSLSAALSVLPKVLINPGAELLSIFSVFTPRQAMMTGLLFTALALGCAELSLLMNWIAFPISGAHLWVLGIVSWLSLWMGSAIARLTLGSNDNWSSDVFLSGAALLPMGAGFLLSGISIWLGPIAWAVLAVFVANFTMVTLYNGCTQLHNLSEQSAVLVVPTIILVCGGMIAFVMQLLRAIPIS
jgi:tetratricopeptide (TPR) repeat protein